MSPMKPSARGCKRVLFIVIFISIALSSSVRAEENALRINYRDVSSGRNYNSDSWKKNADDCELNKYVPDDGMISTKKYSHIEAAALEKQIYGSSKLQLHTYKTGSDIHRDSEDYRSEALDLHIETAK